MWDESAADWCSSLLRTQCLGYILNSLSFALSPNSAPCERVFSLLKLFFGDQQAHSLADQIEAALMLAYNKRQVG